MIRQKMDISLLYSLGRNRMKIYFFNRKEMIKMKKKISKILYISGDIVYAGIGATGVDLFARVIAWAFSEFENDLKK